MSKTHDLTTQTGLKSALGTIGPGVAAYAMLGPVGLLGYGAVKTFGSLFGGGDSKSTIKEQEEAAIAIIRAGKDAGAKSVDIEIEQQAGLKVAGTFKAEGGTGTIDTSIGKSGKMTMKVVY